MKINKKYILVSFVLILLGFSYWYFNFDLKNKKSLHTEENNELNISSENKIDNKVNTRELDLNLEDINKISVSLIVGENNYQTKVNEGSNVYFVMEQIKKENKDFDFKYKEYPSLGIFIEEINGVADSSLYWIYYVNGKEASVGVSNYIIKNGDIISWSQK